MAKPQLADGFIKALIGFYSVYLLVVIARAGYETGQVFAGKTTLAEAASRFDVSGTGLVAAGLILFLTLKKSPPT